MDPQISESIEKLKSEKRIIAKKLMEFSNCFKNSIAKLEKQFEERFETYEKKLKEVEDKLLETIESKVVTSSEHTKNDINELIIVKIDTISRDIESLKTKEIDLTDDVNHLETERTRVNDKIIEIDNVLIQLKENVTEAKQAGRKQGKYDRRGYCKELERCPFFHTKEVCRTYVEKGLC